MNPIKKLNEFTDKFLTDILKKYEDYNNADLILTLGLACFMLGCGFMCSFEVFNTFHKEPIETILGFISLIFVEYIVFRMIIGKNQIVSEILKRMDKE